MTCPLILLVTGSPIALILIILMLVSIKHWRKPKP
jgi:hypothetical protein